MNWTMPSYFRTFMLLLLAHSSSLMKPRWQSIHRKSSPSRACRFTVITPNLIRVEYAADKNFTNSPTLFATERAAHFDGSTIKQDDHHLSIDTGALSLDYTDDRKAAYRRQSQDHHSRRIGSGYLDARFDRFKKPQAEPCEHSTASAAPSMSAPA